MVMLRETLKKSDHMTEYLTTTGRSIFTLLVLMLIFSAPGNNAFAASMTAQVNRAQLSIDESLVLTIVSDGIQGQPDLAPLATDFEVLGTSTRREVKIINGAMSELQSWDIEMIPKRTGTLVIPPLSLQGVSSNPVEVQVSAAATGQQQAQGTVFLEVNIDNPSPMVQAQVIYTVRFFSAVRIVDGELSEPQSEKLTIRRLGDDTGYFQQRNGRRYRVVERRYAVFARESGEIEIPPVTLRVSVPDENDSSGSFFGRVKRLNRRGPAVTLDVRPKPASDSGAWWLPAKSVSLNANWEGDVNEFRVGEPVTRALTLQVDGVTGEQLPELTPLQVPGLKVYADKPEIVEQPAAESLQSRRVDKWAIIPQAAGELTLPAIELPWFDTISETYQVAMVPSQVINVLPAANTTAANTDAASAAASEAGANALVQQGNSEGGTGVAGTNSGNTDGDNAQNLVSNPVTAVGGWPYWRTLALAAIAAWLLSSAMAVWLWWRNRYSSAGNRGSNMRGAASTAGLQDGRSGESSASAKAALRQVDKSIKNADSASTIATAVLHWAACRWPHSPPHSLHDLAQRYPASATELQGQLHALDSMAYGRDANVPEAAGKRLQHRFSGLPELIRSASAKTVSADITKASELPEL